MTSDMAHTNGRRVRPGAIAAGAVLFVLGLLFLLDTTGTVRVQAGQLIAPMILIAGFFSLRYRPVPEIVPPVPSPATK